MREYIDIAKAARGEALIGREPFKTPPGHAPSRDLPIYIALSPPSSPHRRADFAGCFLAAAVVAARGLAAGRSLAEIAIKPGNILRDHESPRRATRSGRTRPHGGMGVLPPTPHGFADADRVQEVAVALRIDRGQARDRRDVDAMTIIGNARQCRDQIQAHFAAGGPARVQRGRPRRLPAALRAVAPAG
jgi:hypothetical protein